MQMSLKELSFLLRDRSDKFINSVHCYFKKENNTVNLSDLRSLLYLMKEVTKEIEEAIK